MQTGNNDPKMKNAGRKRRSDRYYTPMPVPAPSADSTGEIPIPKAMQRIQQTGQANVEPAPDVVAPQPQIPTPAAAFDPEKPRRQTGVQPAVAAAPAAEVREPMAVPAPEQPLIPQASQPMQPMQTGAQPMFGTGTAPMQPMQTGAQPMFGTGTAPMQPMQTGAQPMFGTGTAPMQPMQTGAQPMFGTGTAPMQPMQTGAQPVFGSRTAPVKPLTQPMQTFYGGVQQPMQTGAQPMYTGPQTPLYMQQSRRTTGMQPAQPGFQTGQQQVPPVGYGWQQGGVPPQQPTGFGQQAGNQPPVPPRKQDGGWKRAALIAAGVIAAAAIVISLIIGIPAAQRQQAMVNRVNSYNAKYCEGVYVDGIALGGMSQEEAAAAVMAQAQERTGSWAVRLTYQGQLVSEINAGMLGMTIDVQDALEAAWMQGHTGTAEERSAAMDVLQQAPYEAWSAQPSSDTSVIDELLETIRLQVYRVPQDASIAAFAPDASNPFTFNPEVSGRMLDVAPIKQQIYHMLETMTSGDIEVTPTYVQPEVTVADLQKTVMLRASAYTEISTTSTEDRNNNIRRAFELCNGTILAPGETFSFNGKVGERSTENGFFHALEYVYDELTDGVGGGVCQASTTLMQAAIKAGLTVTDHTPHSEKANYSEYGQDATVYWNGKRRIDMKFKNNTEGNIYIVCSVQSNPNNRKRYIAKVDIYGLDLNGVRYEMVSEMVEEMPFERIERRDKDMKYVTYKDETHVATTGRIGYVYDTYRLTYVNGVDVAKDFIFQSTYKKRDEVTYVGIVERQEW